MKKIGVLFFLLFFFTGACALAPRKAMMMPMDLSLVKGNWEGYRNITFDKMQHVDFTAMEFFNDSLPLKGKISIAFLGGSDTRNYSFENGYVDPQGNLFIPLTDINKITLALYREGERIKLDGYYTHRDIQGRLTLYKK